MKTRPTIQDIADAADVSKATVSRVLNGTAGVRPEKKTKVNAAIERLGFRPNTVARSLAYGRSLTIGVVTQNIGSPFYDAISQGVIAGLNETAFSPIFVDGQWNRANEIEATRALVGRRVDGLLLIGGELNGKDIREIAGSLPTLLVGRRSDSKQFPSISIDNFRGARMATRYLIEKGHRQIAFLTGLPGQEDSAQRLAGYERALRDAKLPVDPDLILPGDFSAETAEKLITTLCGSNKSFTAIFAANDISAFGARLALYRRSIQVPRDVSLIGFDNQMESAFVTPPLTTVNQPGREMGIRASQTLRRMIQGESAEPEVLEPQLIIRESVQSVQA